MARSAKSVLVRVPASTSNLGSGFDTLGLAVHLHTHVRVTLAADKAIDIVSPIRDEERAGAQAIVEKAAVEFFQRSHSAPFGIKISLQSNVPVARGLGYSATVRLGVVAGLNALSETGWNRDQLLDLITALEGHPDNASPAIFGGFTVSGMVKQTVRCLKFRVSPELKLITLIPRFKVSTEKARSLLPERLGRADAAHGLNRAALITAAFAAKNYEALSGLFDDRVHQPYRETLIPQLTSVIRAGEGAGAIGGFLSGSGSAIICLTLERSQAVASAMKKESPDSQVEILSANNAGFQIVRKASGKGGD